ncbi:MAG: hypothetical protein JWP97_2636 [Labilithrix sp.]|nr:hypothetical protein [Labilithrix sp.]
MIDKHDGLDDDLRALPPVPHDRQLAGRLGRQGRAAYLARFEGGRLYLPLRFARSGARVAFPAALAAFVGLYMTWAIGAAAALLQ